MGMPSQSCSRHAATSSRARARAVASASAVGGVDWKAAITTPTPVPMRDADQQDHHEPPRPEPQELRADQADHAPTSWSSPGELQEGLLEVALVRLEERGVQIPGGERPRHALALCGRDGGAEHVAVDACGDAGVVERAPTRLEVGDAHDDARRPTRGEDLVDRTRRDETAASHDRDPIRHLLDLREDVAGDEHRAALGPEAPQQTSDLDDPGRVQAVGRLIEDQQRGVLEQRGGDAEPLLHPERVGADHVPRAGREPDAVEGRVDGLARRCRRSAPGSPGSAGPVNRGKSAGASTIEPTRRITPARPPGTSVPRTLVRPAEAATRPSRQRIVVVFPAPFGPRNPNTPPSGTSRSSPSRATVGGFRNRR